MDLLFYLFPHGAGFNTEEDGKVGCAKQVAAPLEAVGEGWENQIPPHFVPELGRSTAGRERVVTHP